MASLGTSGFSNPMDFYRTLLDAAKRGLLTADQLQAVWTVYSEALPSGAPHLAEAPAVWQALLGRVGNTLISLNDALDGWRLFVGTGTLPPMSEGSLLVVPVAGASIRPIGAPDLLYPAGQLGVSGGAGGGPPIVLQDGGEKPRNGGGANGTAVQSTSTTDVICICCVRKDPFVLKKEPYSLRVGDAMAYGHKFTIRVETVWSEGKPKCPCNLQWFEWTNIPYQGGPEEKSQWDDLYDNYLQARKREEEYHRQLEAENPRLPKWSQDDFKYQPMFKPWYDAMRQDTECPVGVVPIDFRDAPRISGRGKTRVLNFLVRVSCCPACAKPCPPRQLRLSQIIVIDEQSRLRATECEVLREGEAFVDENGDPLPEQEPGLPK